MASLETITVTRHEDGSYTADSFPEVIRVSRTLMEQADRAMLRVVDGDRLILTFANGSAEYRMGVAVDEFGDEVRAVKVSQVREDMLDFPTAWRIQSEGLTHADPRCSAAQTDGALLCDCGAVRTEWERRVESQRAAV